VVEGLPNFAMLYGPNGNLGHNSIILMTEAQSRYISTLVREVVRGRTDGAASLTVTPKKARVDAYNRAILTGVAAEQLCRPQLYELVQGGHVGLDHQQLIGHRARLPEDAEHGRLERLRPGQHGSGVGAVGRGRDGDYDWTGRGGGDGQLPVLIALSLLAVASGLALGWGAVRGG
jgi:hypothetical protein